MFCNIFSLYLRMHFFWIINLLIYIWEAVRLSVLDIFLSKCSTLEGLEMILSSPRLKKFWDNFYFLRLKKHINGTLQMHRTESIYSIDFKFYFEFSLRAEVWETWPIFLESIGYNLFWLNDQKFSSDFYQGHLRSFLNAWGYVKFHTTNWNNKDFH